MTSRGEAFQSRVEADYEPSLAEAELVAEVAATLDEIDRLKAALNTAPTVVDGDPNPLFAAVRNHRTVLRHLLARLGLDEAGEATGGKLSTDAARKLALVRHHGRAS